LSVTLLDGGRVVESLAFGSDAPSDGSPITADTIFQAASLSKQAILFIALKLVEAKQLDLDRPLVQYQAKPMVAPEARIDQVTARHVLTHTTGWPNWPANDGPFKAVRPIGEWGYSGASYMLLQEALEGITREAPALYTRRLLFDPLGMSRSSFVWLPAYETTATRGFERDGTPGESWRPERANGASSLHTTSREYGRLLESFLSEEVMARYPQVYRQQVAIDERLGWSLGWGTARGVLWQWGHSNGFKTFVAIDPERKRGIVCLANGAGGQRVNREWVNGWLRRNVDAFYFQSVDL
jgi:CubicO group peptidase (beta-lactamase class C family)